MIPRDAAVAADVYKAGVLAGHLWRVGDEVTFASAESYAGPPVAFTLPVGIRVTLSGLRLPPFFEGLLPEGTTRRRDLARSLHVAEDDALAMLALIGADTIGDVQVLPAGEPLPDDRVPRDGDLADLDFAELWAVPARVQDRSTVPGTQPKLSYHSRSLAPAAAGMVILKFSPSDRWHAVLENEKTFMDLARDAGLTAPSTRIVQDRVGVRGLAVARFDRSARGGRLVRHAQEDGTQVLGLYPGQKYDPDARTLVGALAEVCSAPVVATRDFIHQMIYSYVVGNNDMHAKNLSVGQDPDTGLWAATPVYDVLHTWPYETDHTFHPAVRDAPTDAVARKHWLALGADLGVPRRVVERLCGRVAATVGTWGAGLDSEALPMPDAWLRDLRRRISKRIRDIDA